MPTPYSLADWEEKAFEEDSRWARGVMQEIVRDVLERSEKNASPTYANVQGNLQEGGTYDADENLVCGVYL